MNVYYARLWGDGDLAWLADTFRRAGCAVVVDGGELDVYVPPEQLEQSAPEVAAHIELAFFLRAVSSLAGPEPTSIEILEERLITIPDGAFETLRARTG